MPSETPALEPLNFRDLFEAAPGLYLVLTPNLKIVAVSDAYLKATMTKRENILNKELFEVFPDNPDDPSADGVRNLRLSLERVKKNNCADTMAVQKYDVRRSAEDGGAFEERFWSPINAPVFDKNNKLSHIIHRVEDVTEFMLLKQQMAKDGHENQQIKEKAVEMEAEIYLRAQQLQQANEDLESFSYSVSHDLRAPLRAIIGFGQLLMEENGNALNESGIDHLTRVINAAKRMGLLIDGLLNLSKLSRKEIHKNKVDLTALAKELIAELRLQDKRELTVTIQPDLVADGDTSLLRVVLQNLLSNALKFTTKTKEAKIEFGKKKENQKTIFFIQDNGAGFDMAYSDKLFNAFQRLHSSHDFEGTGIGLATARKIIHRHNGAIWAQSSPDKGATFFFTIP
jgi:signal transduction histidine kinase